MEMGYVYLFAFPWYWQHFLMQFGTSTASWGRRYGLAIFTKSRSALIQISWGDSPQGNSSRAWQGRSHISREGVSPVPLQPGTRGILLWGGQHAPVHTYAWGILIVDHGILPWSSFEVVSQFLVPSAESSLSVRSYLISWTITFVCHFVSDFINH